ncbi:hypothetical protein ES704_03007 [subsurface metagenome]|jgi:hypothetical protein
MTAQTNQLSKKDRLVYEVQQYLKECTQEGIIPTFRNVWYKLVAKQILPNLKTQYKYLSRIITDARIENIIPFEAFSDPERLHSVDYYLQHSFESHIEYFFESLLDNLELFSFHTWENQPNYVEVWIEKNALFEQFKQVTRKRKVTLVSCKGYPSITILSKASRRIKEELEKRNIEKVVILYFGDYDPSGKDIPRHVCERLREVFELDFEMNLVALTSEQIEKYNLPSVPAKTSDTRTKNFLENYGDKSVELDALDFRVLRDIIDNTISKYYDESIYEETQKEAQEIIKKIQEKKEETNLTEELQRILDLFME